MRKASIVIGLCLILAMVLNVMAIQRMHPDIMRDIGSTRGSLQRNIEASDGDAAAMDAVKLEGFFKEIVPMYERMGNMDSAILMATKAALASADAALAAMAGDMDKAMAAHGNIVGACRGCHGQYREKAPDGSYRIKRPGG